MFDIHERCGICLKVLTDDPVDSTTTISAEQLIPGSDGQNYQEIHNDLVSPCVKVLQAQLPINYFCSTCCSKLEDAYWFRNQCVEILKFVEAVRATSESGCRNVLESTLQNKRLLMHLQRLGIISSVELNNDQVLLEIGFGSDDQKIDILINEVKSEQCSDTEIDTKLEDFSNRDGSLGDQEDHEMFSYHSEDNSQTKNGANATTKQCRKLRRQRPMRGPPVCPFTDCREALGDLTYGEHLEEFHRHVCKRCGLILASKLNITRHVELHNDLSVKCTYCDAMFVSVPRMRTHARMAHRMAADTYKCEDCDKKLGSRTLLNKHRQSAHFPKECDICKTKVESHPKLQTHFKYYHSEMLLECSHCDKKYIRQQDLDYHLLHHMDNPTDDTKKYFLVTLRKVNLSSCDQCEKQFISDKHLESHLSEHIRGVPQRKYTKRSKEDLEKLELKFQCDQCDARYRIQASLEAHIKTHSKSSICYKCEGVFDSETALSLHIANEHSAEAETLDENNQQEALERKPSGQRPSRGPTVCPISDCLQTLENQTYADHLEERHRYTCKHCGIVMAIKLNMTRHVEIHNNPTVKCTFCESKFVSVTRMRTHARSVHQMASNSYECDECDKKFEGKRLLNDHRQATHFPKQCNICESTVESHPKLMAHFKARHSQLLLECNHCDKKYIRQRDLDYHMLQHMETPTDDDKDFYQITVEKVTLSSCNQCERQFISAEHLQAHIIDHKTAPISRRYNRRSKEDLAKLELKYECNICKARYRLPGSLDAHIRTHMESYICDECGAIFKTKTYLKLHVTNKHSRDFRFSCEFCQKAFSTRTNLDRHRRVHTGERPYPCDLCEARFKTHDGYRKHMRRHTGERPFQCELCPKTFLCQSSFKNHRLVHSGAMAFACFYCDQRFNVSKNRKRHIERIHPGLPTKQQDVAKV
ncbi:zinc finger protein 761-like [Uranotaenia lowii]|uniref:zinc finger protein 761-like n=1 Tax=Uranotaenia lowii TaxID=190385 RepID=UPI0024793914|nr:zinc finger protein 761-like [Uranotaenia lowii]